MGGKSAAETGRRRRRWATDATADATTTALGEERGPRMSGGAVKGCGGGGDGEVEEWVGGVADG